MIAVPGSIEFFREFAERIEIRGEDECWPFALLNTNGYGKIIVNGRQISAHRMSYRMHWGPIPNGLFICHQCDNPACVNPLHLFIGSAKDNTADMLRKGRNRNGFMDATHCKRGHEFTESNTRVYDGRRYCRACDNARSRYKSQPRERR